MVETKYSKEKCFELAQTCKNRTEFLRKYGRAYYYSNLNKWLDDMFGQLKQKNRDYWTKEKCFECAKHCSSKIEFQKKFNHAYNKSLKKGWIKNMDWFISPLKQKIDYNSNIYTVYVYEDIVNFVFYVGLTKNIKRRIVTHKVKDYKTKKYDSVYSYFSKKYEHIPNPVILEENLTLEEAQFCENYWKIMYETLGWITLNKSATGVNISSIGGNYKKKYSFEDCYKIALKYKSTKELKTKEKNIYNYIISNKWLEKMPWLYMKKPNNYWNYEQCLIEAKKYKTMQEFNKNSNSAYCSALKNDWLKNYDWLQIKHRQHLTRDYCYNIAKKYNTITLLKKENYTVWFKSKKENWLNDYTWLQQKNKLTYEYCYEIAKQCKNRMEFKKTNAYHISLKKGWIDDWEWLKKTKTPNNFWENYDNCKKESEKYNSRTEFSKRKQLAYISSLKHGWLNDFFPSRVK